MIRHFQFNITVMQKENVRVKLDTTLEKYSLENNAGLLSLLVGKCRFKHSEVLASILFHVLCNSVLQESSLDQEFIAQVSKQSRRIRRKLLNNCTCFPSEQECF